MRYAVALIGMAACLTGCGATTHSTRAVGVVPDLYGDNLDDAEEELNAREIAYSIDSGDDEVVFEHLWTVCAQSPAPGRHARFVTLTVEHFCDG